MKDRNALTKLHTHRGLPVFKARNEPNHPKHKHPMIFGYSTGATRNPAFMKDDGHFPACTPHFGDLAMMDFDYHPDWKKDWINLTDSECQELLQEYLKEFAALIPDWHLKVLLIHKSGSGRGIHVWFKRPYNPDSELNGRPRFAGGDLFAGKGYCILYHPGKLWDSVRNKWPAVHDLTDSDVELIKAHRKAKKAVRKRKPKQEKELTGSFTYEKLPTSQELAIRFKDGVDCSSKVFNRIQRTCGSYFYENLCNNRDYDEWSPRNIALQLMCLPLDLWKDEVCRDIVGMCLCQMNIYDSRLLDLYVSLPYVERERAIERWPEWKRIAIEYEKPVNFGKICMLVKKLNRNPSEIERDMILDNFFSTLVPNPEGLITNRDLYNAFAETSISQSVFIKHFNSNWKGVLGAEKAYIKTTKGKNAVRVRGYKGISLK